MVDGSLMAFDRARKFAASVARMKYGQKGIKAFAAVMAFDEIRKAGHICEL